jgi:Tfp pilus tip-associated adhesin PilY1
VTKDPSGNLWIYWGTGDKTDPTAPNAQEHFYAVKDNDRTSTYSISNIDNITSDSAVYDPQSTSKVGYRIQLSGGGEKMLADPTIFGDVVYFTTYTPPVGSNPCEQGGVAKLYGFSYRTGGPALPGSSTRSRNIGFGIPSAPVLSMKPGGSITPDLYVTTSGGGGAAASTQRVDMDPPGARNRTNMLYWLDKRIQ